MNSDHWLLLGIEPTTDSKSIRRAYAKKAKQLHPEEHPQPFQALRQAYEQALAHAQGEENVPQTAFLAEDMPADDSELNHAALPQADEVFSRFWEKQKTGNADLALQQLSRWWFHPGLPRKRQHQFNRLFLDAALDEGIDLKFLAEIVWTLYWPRDELLFEVTATPRRKFMFQQKIRQSLEVGLWDVRFKFNQFLANGEASKGFSYLEDLWRSPDYDHYGKRGLLRLLFLRHAVENVHLTTEDLKNLDRIFQFRHSASSYSPADLNKLQIFENKRDEL